MARLPAHQARPGRPEIWAALRALNSATGEEIRKTAAAQWATAEDYLLSLVAAGIVIITSLGQRRRDHVFALVQDTGAEAPRVRKDGTLVPPTKTEALWRSIKMLGSFTYAELAAAAGSEGLQARDYCQHLARAGYLLVTETKHPNPTLYRLAPGKNTGPLPPQIQRTKAVFDPNLRQIVWADADAAASRYDRGAE
jgi:hypothetical protein